MGKKAVFLNPPFKYRYSREMRSPAVTKSGTLYYPMWLAYAAGYTQDAGIEIDLIDAPPKGLYGEELYNKIKNDDPFLLVMETSTPAIDFEAKVAKEIKDYIGDDLFVILVGTHVTALPNEVMNKYPWVDAVAVGEYDETIRELALALKEGKDPVSVKGMVLRQEDGTLKHTGVRPLIEDLDKLPWVSKIYKQFLDYKDYFYSHSRHPIVTIVTGRGCPYQCTYCVLPQTMMGHKYRVRSIDDVVGELLWIQENFPDVEEIMIEDDTLTVNKKRVIELSKKLIEAGFKIPWSANSRADVDEEALIWMRKAGCRLLCVGFESADQKILDNIKKNIKVEQYFKFREATKKAGIMVHGCFMVGNKGETKETLRKTLELAKKLNTDTVQFFPIMVYPGTEAYEWAKQNNYLDTTDFSEWLTEEGWHKCVVSTEEVTSEELVEFCDQARIEYYLRPAYIWYKLVQSIKNPEEGKRNLKSFKTFFKYLIKAILGVRFRLKPFRPRYEVKKEVKKAS